MLPEATSTPVSGVREEMGGRAWELQRTLLRGLCGWFHRVLRICKLGSRTVKTGGPERTELGLSPSLCASPCLI